MKRPQVLHRSRAARGAPAVSLGVIALAIVALGVIALPGMAPLASGASGASLLPLPPRGDRSIHDLAGVLSPGTVERLEARHKELFDKTGVAIVVIAVKRLDGETLSDFAVRVGAEWGAGRRGQDRGIVIAITTDEPHIFVATGYGAEGFLPDGRVGSILDRVAVGPLRGGDFDAAIDGTSTALVAVCAAEFGVSIGGVEPAAAPPEISIRGVPPGVIVLIVLVALVVLFRFIFPSSRGGWRRGMWYGGGFGGGLGGGFGRGFGGGFGGGGGGFGGFGGGGFGGGGAGR